MATSMLNRCKPLMELAAIAETKFMIFALDASKEQMALLDKARHENPYVDAQPTGAMFKCLRGFLAQCRAHKAGAPPSATQTPGERRRAVIASVADLLHRSAVGRLILRAVLSRMVEHLETAHPAITFALVEAREADILTLNRDWTFRRHLCATARRGGRGVAAGWGSGDADARPQRAALQH